MEHIVNYYEILGLQIEASEDDIKREIQQKRKMFTSKANSPKREIRQEAETKIAHLGEAQKTLLKKDKRSEYDQKLKIWLASQPKQTGDSASRETYDSGQDLVAMGWEKLNQGNIPEALHMAKQATIRDGLNADAWALLGEANYRWGEIEEGINSYRQAIKLHPNDAYLYYSLGCIYEDQQKWQEAYQQYDRALIIEPGSIMYRASKAVVQVKTGQYDEGISELRECVSADPNNKTFQWFLAIAYMNSAHQGWFHLPEDIVIGKDNIIEKGYYAINREQVALAQERISAAELLEFDDPQLASDIEAAKKDVSRMLERKFEGNIKFAVIATLIWSFFTYGIGLALGPAYYFAARAPSYALNRRMLFEAGVLSGKDNKMYAASMAGQNMMARLSNFAVASARKSESSNDVAVKALALLPMLMLWALITVLLPVVTVYYFVKNYTGENAPPKAIPSPAENQPTGMPSASEPAPKPEASASMPEVPASIPIPVVSAPAPIPDAPASASMPKAPVSTPIPAVPVPISKAQTTKTSIGMPKWAIPAIGGMVVLALFAGGLLYYQKSQREAETKLAREREVTQQKEEETRRLAEQAARLEAEQKAQKEEEVRRLAGQASQLEAEQKAQKEEEVRRLSEQVARLEAEQKAQADRQAQLQQQGQPRQQTARPAGRNNQSSDDAMLNNAHKSLDQLLKQ